MNKYRIFLVFLCLLCAEWTFGQYHIETITNASNGDCNGAITVAVDTADAPHEFRWSKEGETGTGINDLCPGIYAVVITDKNGCSWELEAEVGKTSGCYIEMETFRAEILHVCGVGASGSILVYPNSSMNYTYEWLHGAVGPFIDKLSIYSYTVIISDPSDRSCSVTKTFSVEAKTDCGPAPGVDSIPIFINEVYNGFGSQEEYIELVVKGDGTCAPVDLRGYMIDDNNGDFSDLNHGICGTGFSGGHIRFKRLARWAAVAPGSKILIYNPAAKHPAILTADDPIDENGDGVYILPVTDDGFEGTHLYPSYSNPTYFPTNGTTVNYAAAKWAYIALKDEKDAIQIRYPDGTYCHGLSYGAADYIHGGLASLQISTGSTVNEVIYFNTGSPNEVANFGLSVTPSPGLANNSDNENYFNSIACVGGSLIVNELSNGNDEQSGYVELLVKSNGNCGVVDIRGYIIDDNNGDFSETLAESGIAPGHLRFPNTDTWANVVGGSLIVIYNEKSKNPAIGTDDPTDANGDKVYILPASHLEGSGVSPTLTKPYDYDLNATYGSGSWDYVALFSYGDAIQVVAPDGSYQHGISYGSLGTTNGGPDDLMVAAANNKNGKVYYFNDSNPKLVSNFEIGTTPSPGAANSSDNQAYINGFCIENGVAIAATSRINNPKHLNAKLYPNPFSNLINIEVNSPEAQEVVIQLHDFLGRLLYEKKEGLNQGFNDLSINLDRYVSDGIYFMSIRANREVVHEEKVVCVRK